MATYLLDGGVIETVQAFAAETAALDYPAELTLAGDWVRGPDLFNSNWGAFVYGGAFYAVVFGEIFVERNPANTTSLQGSYCVVKSTDQGLTWNVLDPLGGKQFIHPSAGAFDIYGIVVSGSLVHLFCARQGASQIAIAKGTFHLDTETWDTSIVISPDLIVMDPNFTGNGPYLGGIGGRLYPVERSDGSFLIIYDTWPVISSQNRKKIFAVTLTGTIWGTPFSIDEDSASTMSYTAVTYHPGQGDRTHVWIADEAGTLYHKVVELSGAISSRSQPSIFYYGRTSLFADRASESAGLISFPTYVWSNSDPSGFDAPYVVGVIHTVDGTPDRSSVEIVSLDDPINSDGFLNLCAGAWNNQRTYTAFWVRFSDKAIMGNSEKQGASNSALTSGFGDTNTVILPGPVYTDIRFTMHARGLGSKLGLMLWAEFDDNPTVRFLLTDPLAVPDPCPSGGGNYGYTA